MSDDNATQPQVTPPDFDKLAATRARPSDGAAPGVPVIPGYDLLPEIARGGMGVVYRARDLAFDREVAVKVMLPGMSVAEFVREARITGRLPHPGIPPVYALGALPDGRPFLAMKLIRGDTLDTVLKARTDLSVDRGKLLAAFEQVCQAVGYAHAQGIVHRDLKPSNVMVGAFGEVQVMDWGLAKELRSADPQPLTPAPPTAPEDIAATVAGAIKGTPAYMAPEQARGEPVDARADVFALGGLLTAILTGKPPFVGQTAIDTIIRAAQADLDDAFDRLEESGADTELTDLAMWCLEPTAAGRPADATELAAAVAEYRAEVEERLRRAERERAAREAKAEEQRKRRRTQWALAVSVLLFTTASIFGMVIASLWQTAEGNREQAVIQRNEADKSKGEAEKAQRGEAEARRIAEFEREKLAVFEYGWTMQVAHQEWRNNSFATARNLLNDARHDLRGWEWQYLNRICDSSLLTLKAHPGSFAVYSAAFSTDNAHIVTATNVCTSVWDANTGAELLTLKEPAYKAEFSADGTRIVTASKTVKVWDVKSGAEMLVLKGHTNQIKSASFSPNSKRIVTASKDGTAKVWDARTGDELQVLRGHLGGVAATFSADSSQVITASEDKTAKVWSVDTGEEVLVLIGHSGPVLSAAFSADGKRIITASLDLL